MRYVYLFHEGNARMKELLGGKGANLAEMTNIGLPVPCGMTITTDACREYYNNGKKLPEGLVEEVTRNLKAIEEEAGKRFGDEDDPLLLSVRSGAVFSMPGMMDTILNLGLNVATFKALARHTGNMWFACDTYRRFIQMFSDVVMEIPKDKFEHILQEQKAAQGVTQDQELSVESLLAVIDKSKALYRQEIEDVWEKNRMLSYEVLYDRLLDMTEFGKTVTSCLNRKQLFHVIEQHAGRIFSFDNWEVLLYEEPRGLFHSLNDTCYELETHPILRECIRKAASQKLPSLTPESAITQSLGSLYDEKTRSMLLQPITYQGTILAIFCMKSNQMENFSRTDQRLLQVFADYIAIAIHNVLQFEDALDKSSYDYLSGIYNRSALMQYGETMLQEVLQNRHSIGVLMMDIDDFKKINDTFGHMQGDEVIRRVTAIMRQKQRHGIIARFGGEEFILLIDSISKQELYELAEDIRYACEACRIATENGTISFTISIGCYYQEHPTSALQELFNEADQRLYIAKRNGKNYVQM